MQACERDDQSDADQMVNTVKKGTSRCQHQKFENPQSESKQLSSRHTWNLHVKNKWKKNPTLKQMPAWYPLFNCYLIYLLPLGWLFGSYFIELLPSHLKVMSSLNWANLNCIFMIPKCYLSIQRSNCKLLAIGAESNNKYCKEFN